MPFYPFLGESSPTKIDYRKKCTLILTSLLEDLVAPPSALHTPLFTPHPTLHTALPTLRTPHSALRTPHTHTHTHTRHTPLPTPRPRGKGLGKLQVKQSHRTYINGCGFFVSFFFRFSSGPVKCSILQHFLTKLTHFTLARQHPQPRFQHPPHVRPTSLASPTAGGLTGSNKIMIQIGGHFNP